MSFRNVYYDKRRSKLHLWHTVKGERLYDCIDWVPYVFLPVADKNATVKSPTGQPVEKKTFRNHYEYKTFCEENRGLPYENNLREEIQFLVDRYYKIPDNELEVPTLKIIYFDAEMYSRDGSFPRAEEGKEPISLICCYNSFSDEMHAWGLKPYTGENTRLKYHLCNTTEEVFIGFVKYVHREQPDILTGWNIYNYDLQYFYNFDKNYLEGQYFRRLSPINIASGWVKGDNFNVDIAGVAIVDYLPLFKQFYRTPLPRYGLDAVAKVVAGKGKLDYSEYHNLTELFEKGWNKYVDYCVIDVWRVKNIDDKCKFINLIQALSILTKCPIKYYEQVTALIEGVFLTYYRRQGMCTHKFLGGIKESFPAALVKKSSLGKHKWVIDLDVTSSYPSSMIALNMGFNTYIGKIRTIQFSVEDYNNDTQLVHNIISIDEPNILTEFDVLECTKKKEYPPFYLETLNGVKEINGKALEAFNRSLRNKDFAIAPNGTIFSNKEKGDIANIERYLFSKRKETNIKLAEAKKNKESDDKILTLDCTQNAIKTVLNSIYGALSVPFFRGYFFNIATAITSCGRVNWLKGLEYTNEYLNSITHKDTDYVVAGDTDSLMISLGRFLTDIDEYSSFDKLEKSEKIDKILYLAKKIEEYVNTKCFEDLQLECYNSAEMDFHISFKQEVVAETAIFLAKKKYSMWIVNEKGLPKEEIFSRGIEIIRSDTPEIVKPFLKEIVEAMLKEMDDKELRTLINERENSLLGVLPEDIATNIGCNNIEKYQLENFQARKGTPMHIKGVLNYKFLLRELGLQNTYEDIENNNKVKVVYLEPNKWNFESLAFTRWPKEFGTHEIAVDYKKMIEKYFIKKIDMFLSVMGKSDILNKNEELLELFF